MNIDPEIPPLIDPRKHPLGTDPQMLDRHSDAIGRSSRDFPTDRVDLHNLQGLSRRHAVRAATANRIGSDHGHRTDRPDGLS